MVKKRKTKVKPKIKRGIRTRDRPPRFQQNSNQQTIVKVINRFEKMRRKLPRRKPQNYKYRDITKAPSFQSLKEANGNLSAMNLLPASSNYINLSNMQKMIEDRVRSQQPVLMIEDKKEKEPERIESKPQPLKVEMMPLNAIPQDMIDFFKNQPGRVLGSRDMLMKFLNENHIPYNVNDTRAVMYARLAMARGHVTAEEWPTVLSIWGKTQKPKENKPEPPSISEAGEDEASQPPKESHLKALEKSYAEIETTPVKGKKGVISRIKDFITPNKRKEEEKSVTLPKDYLRNTETGDIIDMAGLSKEEVNGYLDDGYDLVLNMPGSGTGIKPLYGSQIDLMMAPYRKRGYVGVFCLDELSTLLPKAIKGMDRWSCIINTLKISDPESETGHWMGLYCDKVNEKVLELYDSLAYPVSDELLKELKPVIDSMNLPYLLKFKHNTIRNQRANSSTCGFMAVNYLMNRYDGVSWKECSDFQSLEPEAKKLAKRFGYI